MYAAAVTAEAPKAPEPPKDVGTTAEELLAVINAVRANPKDFVPHMQERITRFDGKKLKSRVRGITWIDR